MTLSKRTRKRLASGTVALVLSATACVIAPVMPATAQAARATIHFDTPASDLATALHRFADVTRIQNRPSENGIDRSTLPAVGEPAGIRLPQIHRDTLANGLRIVLAERHDLPLVGFTMYFEAGCTAEPRGRTGVAQLTAALMTSGAGALDALQFAERKQELGAELGVGAALEYSSATLSAMKDQLDDSLALYADMIRRPHFNEADFERERSAGVMQVRHERSTGTMKRGMAALLLPAHHPYARPLSGAGLKSHVANAARDHVVEFHATQFRPQLATLIVVGDTTMEEIRPVLERHFGDWEPSTAAPISVPLAPRPTSPRVYLIDKPGALQSHIWAATIIDPLSPEDEFAAYAADHVAGNFGSRLNMNLREDKHWTYGVGSRWYRLRGPQFYTVRAGVQIDKTAESMAEMRREMLDILDARPITKEELESWRRHSLLSVAGETAGLGDLSGAIETLVRRQLSDDYWSTYADKLRAVTLDAVKEACRRFADPSRKIWMIDTDAAHTESAIQSLDFGPYARTPEDTDSLYPVDL
jgi:zinc protease